MADTRGKIAVLAVDGNYSTLRELGFPLPALAAMQEAGVQLGQACWDVKQSTSGISVSFFWPQISRQSQLSSAQKITKPKKKRRRRKSKKPNDLIRNNVRGEDRDQQQSQAQVIPMDAHSIPESVKSPTPSVTLAESDLVVVKDHIDMNVDDDPDVYYLERNDIPGVCVDSGETSSWTPIKISRSRVRAADSNH